MMAKDKRPYLRPRYSQEAQYVAPALLAAIRDAAYSLIAFLQQYNVVTLKKPLNHCFNQLMRKPSDTPLHLTRKRRLAGIGADICMLRGTSHLHPTAQTMADAPATAPAIPPRANVSTELAQA
ncbi:hypothetical protein ACMX25_29065 [Caballeronia sp. 15715]|uniref:hypothetical protein n=1 Tax=Caballeronia sp. 15715 TaxID=3391030 RepID=UPI0039E4B5C4